MSERSDYQPGVPCWVDTLGPDLDAAKRFYEGLLGWEFVGPGEMPGDPPEQYFVARLRGRDVAGVGSEPEHSPPPAWNTHVAVASVDQAVRRAADAGATILTAPVDASPAGRLAVLSDPVGAMFCVWEPEARQGAQLVNEPSAWSMSVLHTSDSDRAKAFYAEVFGWAFESFPIGGVEGALCRLPGYVGGEPQQPVPRDVVAVMSPSQDEQSQASSRWSVDFWIDDADEAAARAPGLGGTVVLLPHDISSFRTAVLADPRGAIFSVSTMNVGP